MSKGYSLLLKCSYGWFVHYIFDWHLVLSFVVIPYFSALIKYRQLHVALGDYALCQAACLCPGGCWIVHLRQLGGQIKIYALVGLPRVLTLSPSRIGFWICSLLFSFMALSLPMKIATISCSASSFVAELCLGLFKKQLWQ